MNTDKVWIVIVILILVIGGANLLMVGVARSFGRSNIEIFKNYNDATKPWKKEDEGLKELNQRVKDLKDRNQ